MIELRESEMNQPLKSAVDWIQEHFGLFGDNWRFEPMWTPDGRALWGLLVTEEIYTFYKLKWS